ncbi:hypothetical protein B0J13DRAFT_441652 [Dactylonectria estremocensis]|uniref:Uncharacterized protein n=1 Tax=Dactylonectria estremocensis TaxID=1079267 RepID=A0A9P9EX72_9HYPO|nr:hypothetical protein B0J13DRAFT_441652 [Dactylonectria estremocensis]
MKLSPILIFASLALAAATPAQDLADDLSPREALPTEPVARQCESGCSCRRGLPAGIYCGNCVVSAGGGAATRAIQRGRMETHLYQCDSAGGCYSYGPANVCGTQRAWCQSGEAV